MPVERTRFEQEGAVGAFAYERFDEFDFLRADRYLGRPEMEFDLEPICEPEPDDFGSMLEGLDDDDEINDDEDLEDELFELACEVDPLDAEHLPFMVGVRKLLWLKHGWESRRESSPREPKVGDADKKHVFRVRRHLRRAGVNGKYTL